MNLDELFTKANCIAVKYSNGYMVPVDEMLKFGFFPGGYCTCDEIKDISTKSIMVLGQNFQTKAYYDKCRADGHTESKNGATWKNIVGLLDSVNGDLKNKCFFTNVYPGLRKNGSGVGVCPAAKEISFRNASKDLLKQQLKRSNFRLVLVLGKEPANFLSEMNETFSGLEVWKAGDNFYKNIDSQKKSIIKSGSLVFCLLVHPSYASANQRWRSYNDIEGKNAEIEILREAISVAGISAND